MRYELRLHRFLLSMMIALLVLFVVVMFYLNTQPAGEHLQAVVSLLVVIMVASIFAYMGTAEGVIAFYFGIQHSREFIAYLLLGLLSIFSGLYLGLSQAASLQVVCLIVSPHAFFFGLAELRIARHMKRHPRERHALIVCGLCEIAVGVGLCWGFTLPSDRVTELLSGAAVVTILQLTPLLFYRDVSTRPGIAAS